MGSFDDARAEMRIVLTHGCFDILTVGHLDHFAHAKSKGDYLVVSVSSDEIVKLKGPERPLRKLVDRLRMLLELRIVDRTWVCHSPDASDAIRHWQPAWFIQGIDHEHDLTIGEKTACREVGAQIGFSTHWGEERTSDLVRRIRACAS